MRAALPSIIAALALVAGCGPTGPTPGQVQMVGWSGEHGPPELLLVDAATPQDARVLIAGAAGQRFGKVMWAADGESLMLLRQLDGDSDLLRVTIGSGEVTSLHTFAGVPMDDLEFHRQPAGGLIGLSRSEASPLLLKMVPGGSQVESTSLASAGLAQGTWHVAPSLTDEYVLHRDVPRDPTAAATPYALVLDANLDLVGSHSAAPGLAVRCVGAQNGRALACHTTDDNYESASLLLMRGAAGWGTPTELGRGQVARFSEDGQTLLAASGVYAVASPPRQLLSLDPTYPDTWHASLTAITNDGAFVAYGLYDEHVASVGTGERVVIGRHVGVNGDAPAPPTWSWGGTWLYRGGCDEPTEVDTYYCQGVFIARDPLFGSCVSTDTQSYDLLDDCESYAAVGLSDAVARPRP